MSDTEPRYALYYAPEPDSTLGRFGSQWLAPEDRVPPTWVENADLWRKATASPAHYGFHATLKAPFRLHPSTTEQSLLDAVQAMAEDQQPFETPPLQLEAIGRYLALTFSRPCPDMDALHRRCTVEFDRFRAPPTDAERQRRLAAGLSEDEKRLFEQYGYPHILDRFKFHLTLAGPVAEDERDTTGHTLNGRLDFLLNLRLKVADICVFRQRDRNSRFDVLSRATFVN
ncbi:MAG: DUF1045 domain-containing protein [Pseudomonadota bacterium]